MFRKKCPVVEQRTQVRGEPAEDEEIGADFIARLRRRETSHLHHFYRSVDSGGFPTGAIFSPKRKEITYLASSGVQRGIRVDIAAFWLMILLAAVVSQLYGPKNWAITTPISGNNAPYAIFLKDEIFWLLIATAIAVAVGYILGQA